MTLSSSSMISLLFSELLGEEVLGVSGEALGDLPGVEDDLLLFGKGLLGGVFAEVVEDELDLLLFIVFFFISGTGDGRSGDGYLGGQEEYCCLLAGMEHCCPLARMEHGCPLTGMEYCYPLAGMDH